MKLDLSKLQQHAQEEVEEVNSRRGNSENEQYPVVYTAENGKLTVRLLYNLKMGGVQRKVIRHTSDKSKVACMQAYGEECPVCSAISSIETVKGKECGAFSKYGFKIRGVCYAQIIDHDAAYFTDEKDPKKGDVILLMYPKTVYENINKIIVDAGSNIEKILSDNEGIPIVIERSQKKGGFPEYKTYVYPYGAIKSFEDDSEMTGTQKFDKLLEDLPNLGDSFMPLLPTEEVRVANKALAETITQEYLSSNTVNPEINNDRNDIVSSNEPSITNPEDSNHSTDNNSSSNVVNTDNSSDKPDCYGNHKDGDTKCMMCPYEADCYIS